MKHVHPDRSVPSARAPHLAARVAGVLLGAASAGAQQPLDVTFSIDWQGPTIARTTPGAMPITEGDLLIPAQGQPAFGPLGPPQTFLDGGQLGLLAYPMCVGHAPGIACGVEVDALSFGVDALLDGDPTQDYRIFFSTDEYANGSTAVPFQPSLPTEAPVGDSSSDLWVSVNLPPGPLGQGPGVHAGAIDGDGQPSASGAVYPGVGLVEPNVPGTGLPGMPFDLGDNLDAVDLGPRPDPALDPIWFSLDAGFAIPNIPGFNNSNSAQMQGFQGGDVLVRFPGGTVQLYAAAGELGLDALGPGSDDLDALILHENGDPGFQASFAPYDWVPGPGDGTESDMLMFSVRAGSAVIGTPDSIFGLPITEADILIPPVGGASAPGIFIAGENLGLEVDRAPMMLSDDVNALDATARPYRDCNGNEVDDWVDINTGFSCDLNNNGIPDECEPSGDGFCECTSAVAPCGNAAAAGSGQGCRNSTGAGALLVGSGSSSMYSDDLVLSVTQMPANQFGIFFMGQNTTAATLSDGHRCIGTPFFRFQQQVFNTGAAGAASFGPGIVNLSCTTLGMGGCIDIGETWHFQAWYRNPVGGPCGNGSTHSNLANGWSVTFTE